MILYDDGTFLFKDPSVKELHYKYMEKKLTDNEFKILSKQLGPKKDFMSLKGFYYISDYWHPPETKIYLSDNQNKKAVIVSSDDYEISKGVPKEFVRV